VRGGRRERGREGGREETAALSPARRRNNMYLLARARMAKERRRAPTACGQGEREREREDRERGKNGGKGNTRRDPASKQSSWK